MFWERLAATTVIGSKVEADAHLGSIFALVQREEVLSHSLVYVMLLLRLRLGWEGLEVRQLFQSMILFIYNMLKMKYSADTRGCQLSITAAVVGSAWPGK